MSSAAMTMVSRFGLFEESNQGRPEVVALDLRMKAADEEGNLEGQNRFLTGTHAVLAAARREGHISWRAGGLVLKRVGQNIVAACGVL